MIQNSGVGIKNVSTLPLPQFFKWNSLSTVLRMCMECVPFVCMLCACMSACMYECAHTCICECVHASVHQEWISCRIIYSSLFAVFLGSFLLRRGVRLEIVVCLRDSCSVQDWF